MIEDWTFDNKPTIIKEKGENMTRKQKTTKQTPIQDNHIELKNIVALTASQDMLFCEFRAGHNVVAAGSAGTGKTYLGLYLGLFEVMKSPHYQRLIIVRSAVSSRDQGFLPGKLTDKEAVFEAPYVPLVNEICGRGDAYDLLKKKGAIQFITTSFIRGLTWSNAIVLVDEVQNMTIEELSTIITRLGKHSRIILCGDGKQSDMEIGNKRKELSGFDQLIRTTELMSSFRTVWFGTKDIVRSGVAREWLMAREKLGG